MPIDTLTAALIAVEENRERLTGPEVAKDTLEAFLAAEFEGGRHTARVQKLDDLLPPAS